MSLWRYKLTPPDLQGNNLNDFLPITEIEGNFHDGQKVHLDITFTNQNTEVKSSDSFIASYPFGEIQPKNLLILVNGNNKLSTKTFDYYRKHRPGALLCPYIVLNPPGDRSGDKNEIINKVGNYINHHPEICYIVCMPRIRIGLGVHRRTANVHHDLVWSHLKVKGESRPSLGLYPTTLNEGVRYYPFTPENKKNYYPNTSALITALEFPDFNAAKGYIDKLESAYNGNFVLSGNDTGLSGDTYYFDDNNNHNFHSYVQQRQSYMNYYHSDTPVVYRSKNQSKIYNGENITGYCSWGAHSMQHYWKKIKWSGKSQWWILCTFESFNGVLWHGGQGDPTNWWEPDSWGGSGYDNCPIAAVGHTSEPYISGVNNPNYYVYWENGLSFADCAWLSKEVNCMAAFGDPLVKK